MQISSSAFQEGQILPAKYTCQGEDINPPLEFKEVPQASKSLAIIVDDPDAPSGTWTHWTIWNIAPNTKQIEEDSIPNQIVQGKTTWGTAGYRGPCPGTGEHRYFFKLYALDKMLDLGKDATKEELLKAMDGHILEKAELKGLYHKHFSAKPL